jgi:hypothetical protein
MQIQAHTAANFVDAMRGLLPPGQAWQWPDSGMGAQLLNGMAQELARMDAFAAPLLDAAVTAHTPEHHSWRLADYQAIASGSQTGFAQYSVTVGIVKPLTVGSHVGDVLWGARCRYVIAVTYMSGLVDLSKLVAALLAFKQAHAVLFFVDRTTGAKVIYG